VTLGPVAAALCALAVAVLATMSDAASAGPSTTDAIDAKTIYLRDCAVCHGADGHGTKTGPTLEGWGRAGVDYALSTGRMPLPSPDATPERRTPAYDAATRDALVDYVVGLVPGGPEIPTVDPTSGDLAAGGELFRAQCAACHQWAGEGGALLRREAPALDDATATQIAEAVRTGPGEMPVFDENAVDADQLNGLVRYVQYLREPNDRGGLGLWHIGPVAEGGVALAAIGVLMFALRYVGSRR
jgi:ubiquinol-cytochrome c reductase cytochrome c subunit